LKYPGGGFCGTCSDWNHSCVGSMVSVNVGEAVVGVAVLGDNVGVAVLGSVVVGADVGEAVMGVIVGLFIIVLVGSGVVCSVVKKDVCSCVFLAVAIIVGAAV